MRDPTDFCWLGSGALPATYDPSHEIGHHFGSSDDDMKRIEFDEG
jgi:hypothetical protein